MQSIVTELPNAELLTVEGPDTHRFLQGQISCDTGSVTAEQSAPGVYCNVKGRVLADLLALSHGEEETLHLRTGPGMADVLAQALAKFIVFFKAETRNASDDWRAFGIWGDDAGQLIARAFGDAPRHPWQSLGHESGVIVRLPGSRPRFECWMHREASLPPLLQMGSGQQAERLWQLEDIRCGRAHIDPQTSGHYTPQLLNYDINGAVNFHKGCYTGQEVVARMYYRGTAKKRLYRTAVAVSEFNDHMAPVRRDGDRPAGEVIAACADTDESMEMLMILPCKDAEAALEQQDGSRVFELLEHNSGERVAIDVLPFADTETGSTEAREQA